jgi:hypothetical protein
MKKIKTFLIIAGGILAAIIISRVFGLIFDLILNWIL